MDSLFDDLDKVKIQKRTTYKKVQVFDEDVLNTDQVSYGVPTYNNNAHMKNTDGGSKIQEKGFVFNTDKLHKIRNRLENPHEEGSINEDEEDEQTTNNNETTTITQPTQVSTQLINDFYEGGEDLEQDDIIGAHTQVIYEKRQRPVIRLQPQNKKEQTVATQTYDKSRLRRRKFEHYDEDTDDDNIEENRKTQETQVNQTEPIDDSTQKISVTGQSLLFSTSKDDEDTPIFNFQTSGKSLLFQSTQDDFIENEDKVANIHSSMKSTQLVSSTQQNDFEKTQKINSELTQSLEPNMPIIKTQIIAENTKDKSDTQLNSTTQPIDDAELTQPTQINDATQRIERSSTTLETQTLGDNISATIVDTSMPILPLFENNSTNEITQKDQQKTQVDDDIPISEEPSSSNLKIREIEKQLDIEEKEKDKQTEYRATVAKPRIPVKINFTKDTLLANFDSDSDSDTELNDNQQERLDTSSLVNNDFMTDQKLSVTPSSDYQVSEGEEKSRFNLSSSPIKPNKPRKTSILPTYANNLIREINPEREISLSSDSDNDSDLDVIHQLSSKSKATLLSLRVRLSKNKPSKKNSSDKNSLGQLFSTLKRASKKQILQHRKDLMESRGLRLEDLEEEKKMVEDLLEQEIERNLKIREREKRREQSESGYADEAPQESDFEYSGDESNISGSENEDDNEQLLDAPPSDSGLENDYIEEVTYGSKPKDLTLDGDDREEDEGISISKKARMKRKQILETDSETDLPDSAPLDTQPLDTQEHGSIIPPMDMNYVPPRSENIIDGDSEKQLVTKQKELTEEERIIAIKERLKEQKLREEREQKKLQELKKKGINDFLEDEAEESDDEWRGIGGADGELPDEVDSEVERMIDDYSKVDNDIDSIRQKIMDENKEMDLKLVNKILYDIKNGGFRKRGRNDLELELSDDEDNELREFRKRRKELMRQRMLEFGDDEKLMKNPKSKAFFESMIVDINDTKEIPLEHATEEIQETMTETQEDETNKEKDTNKKSKIKISEEFVQKSLSFLRMDESSQEFQLDRKIAQVQHAKVSDMNDLKQKSTLSFCSKLSNSRKIQSFDDDIVDEFESFKRPSVLQSFGSKFDINDKFKEGNKTVTISKSYKTVGGSKASITYLGKSRKLVAPEKKRRTMKNSNIQSSSRLLNIQRDSFDS